MFSNGIVIWSADDLQSGETTNHDLLEDEITWKKFYESS
jgi:hypothetical protein